MRNKFTNKIFGNIESTIFLIIIFLFLDKLFEAIGTTTFFGVNFQIVLWIILIIAIISFISDMEDIEWINKIFQKIFK